MLVKLIFGTVNVEIWNFFNCVWRIGWSDFQQGYTPADAAKNKSLAAGTVRLLNLGAFTAPGKLLSQLH